MILRTKYVEPLEILKKLFGDVLIEQNIERLEKIYEFCEVKWTENLERLSKTQVKYLIIAEAPPWTEETKQIKYFYAIDESKEHIKFSVLLRGLWKSFFGEQNREDILTQLAQKGLLLVDTIPFAMDYKGKRGNQRYNILVNSCKNYLEDKLKNPRINWSSEVKVAFAFKLNAKAVISVFPNGLTLPSGQKILLNEDMIAANNAGYPDAKKLKKIFCL